MSNFRVTAAAVLLALLAACAPSSKPSPPGQAVDAKETAAVDALQLRKKYQDVVTGDEAKGTTLVLYVDRNNLDSMDEPVEDAMIADALSHWKTIWSANHRGRHAQLHLSIRDYYGSQILSRSVKA